MEYKLMIENENINESKESIIESKQGIIDSNECIICFEGSTDEDKVEPIDNFYIMPIVIVVIMCIVNVSKSGSIFNSSNRFLIEIEEKF